MVLLLVTTSPSNYVISATTTTFSSSHDNDDDGRTYVLVGVSGGLQDGFPDHHKMDYYHQHGQQGGDNSTTTTTAVKAIYIGRALVRGTKSYLDVMQPGWRQYVPRDDNDQPIVTINSVVLVSGCHHDANQYWIYAVDSRQFVTILNNEPRFLSITPDTALVDLTATTMNDDEYYYGTDEAVREIARHEIQRQNKTDRSRVAIPIVVAVWYHDSFVPSPAIATLDDGTAITNFPESLAKWAGVKDADRTAVLVEEEHEGCYEKQEQQDEPKATTCSAATPNERQVQHRQAQQQRHYWEGIRRAIRHAEDHPLSRAEWKANGPPFHCQTTTRLGVGPETARINYPLAPHELEAALGGGYSIDFERGVLLKNER